MDDPIDHALSRAGEGEGQVARSVERSTRATASSPRDTAVATAARPLAPLPVYADGFVGRARELDAIAEHFARGVQLVVLHGAGGIGKTRLATEFAAARGPALARAGVAFVNLTDAYTPDEATGAL